MPTDNDFVRCEYTSPNIGDHSVIGPAGFDQQLPGITMVPKRGGDGHIRWHINYGYMGGGSKLLAHKRDIALWPHLFRPLEAVEERMVLPAQKVAAPVPPAPVVSQTAPAPRVPAPPVAAAPSGGLAAEMEQVLQEQIAAEDETPGPMDLDGAVAEIAGLPSQRMPPPPAPGGTAVLPPPPPPPASPAAAPRMDLQAIPGVTPEIAANLQKMGIVDSDALIDFIRNSSKTALMEIRGIGRVKADAMKAYVEGVEGATS